MTGHSLKHIFDSLGFAYDFAFSQKYVVVRKYQDSTTENSLKTLGDTNLFRGWGQTNSKKNRFRSKYGGFTSFVFHAF